MNWYVINLAHINNDCNTEPLKKRTQIRTTSSPFDEKLESLSKLIEKKTPELQSMAPEWWKQWLKQEDEKEIDKLDSWPTLPHSLVDVCKHRQRNQNIQSYRARNIG